MVGAQILDGGLFAQRPARPDRRSAADWALRLARGGGVGNGDPALRLTALCLAAHTDFSTGRGCADVDRIARECGLVPEALFPALDQLVTFLASWTVALASGDLQWEPLPTANQDQRATDRFDAGVNPEH
jgi:hypothetical protein